MVEKVSKRQRVVMVVGGLSYYSLGIRMKVDLRRDLEDEFKSLRSVLGIDNDGDDFCPTKEDLGIAKELISNIKGFFREAATTKSEWEEIERRFAEMKKELNED